MKIRFAALAFTYLSVQSVWSAPLLEVDRPLLKEPPYEGAALKHFETGNPPPLTWSISTPFYTATIYSAPGKKGNPPTYDYEWSQLYWFIFMTDKPLHDLAPQFNSVEGLRILRHDDSADFQVQSAGFILNIQQQEKGWKVLQWRIEDTIPAENPSWRKPLPEIEPQKVLVIVERSADPSSLSRDFMAQNIMGGHIVQSFRFMSQDSNNIVQALTESYQGDHISKDTLTRRSRLKRMRVAGTRQYKQLVTTQYFEDGEEYTSQPSTQLWEVDDDGTRRQVR